MSSEKCKSQQQRDETETSERIIEPSKNQKREVHDQMQILCANIPQYTTVHSDSTHDDVVRSRFIANKVIDGEEKISYIFDEWVECDQSADLLWYDTIFFTIDK